MHSANIMKTRNRVNGVKSDVLHGECSCRKSERFDEVPKQEWAPFGMASGPEFTRGAIALPECAW